MRQRGYKDILNIPGVVATKVSENKENYLIEAEILRDPDECPHCGMIETLRPFGSRTEVLRDASIHCKKVAIEFTKKRYRCSMCRATSVQEVPGRAPARDCTQRLVDYIKRESVRRTFLDVAGEIGLDEKTVRNLFVEHSIELENSVRFETPRWMGIDEVFYRGRYLIVVTNLERRTVVDLLFTKSANTLISYFLSLPDPEGVELVSMDMEGMYANKVREMLPRAIIVIDKFHIIQRMTHTMKRLINDVRMDISKKQSHALRHDRFGLLMNTTKLERDMTQYLRTETWMNEFPILRQGWEMLQRFYAMWELTDEAKARKHYAAWLASVPSEFHPRLKFIIDIFDKRPDDIFSYFNTPITNAYTESANAKIKQIQRLGHGYEFPALRAKVLYSSVYRVCPRYQRPLPEAEFQQVLRKKGDTAARAPAQSMHQPLLLPLAEQPSMGVPEDVKCRDAELRELGADTEYINYGAPFERGQKIA